MKKSLPLFLTTLVIALVAIVGYQAHNLANAEQALSEVVLEAEKICTSLECEVERRTNAIFERDYGEYMETSRLKALQEINSEMMEMTQNPEKRLNK